MHTVSTDTYTCTRTCTKLLHSFVRVIHVHVHVLLTDDDCQDDQDYDDEDDPQLHILPPQLALETSGRALEHVGILVEVV